MELTLLGTGAPDGLPRPGCPCARCALATGPEARAATSLLVDHSLLLDLTPGAALAAARAGRSVHEVRQVLLSHPHDGPAMEFPAGLPSPVRVPDGQELSLISGHRVRAVPLDAPGTGYEIVGPSGARMLYLPPGGAPAGLSPRQAPYDLVASDVLGRPDALARLRAVGAVTATTDVLAVHLGHQVPPGAEARRRLAALGARAEPDGTSLTVGEYREVPDVPRRTLVLGGVRSGKSVEAERRLAGFPDVVYAATGGGGQEGNGDPEWWERVEAHRERRPPGWRTVEGCDLVPLLAERDAAPLLVDCLARWLSDAMDRVNAWDDGAWRNGARAELHKRAGELVAAFRATRRTVVAVSEDTASAGAPTGRAGRRFRDELGRLNAAVAEECEEVLLMVAGTACRLRG
ncbi:bifunctional adenosylcobinamide kinase/adenosylcobinamide-phosphate guanylyltransferase [Streptomyces sp. NPDC005438]|uniref:bifunctional adenosylcobinamide kinase/adenosylcobinamide-phosphate guanylyltransferase n=1 Tax=Streptomyces sp. NPDC005438 TaxID=3156880 RepID=UPI0033B75D89